MELAHLFTRPFWLDEWHTAMVANRATLSEVFSDLYRGSDLGPPLLHVIAWVLARLGGGQLPPTSARIVSFGAIVVTLIFVFLALRRRFGRVASSAGILAIATHYIVMFHMFEFRYYGLWLAFCAAVAWTLGVDAERGRSRRRDIMLGLLSVLLCLTHWLALGSLMLLCAGALVTFGRDWRSGLRRIAPAAAGAVVVMLSIPFVRAQRASVLETSWMRDPGLTEVLAVLNTYWGGFVLSLAVLVILAAFVIPALKTSVTGSIRGAARDPSIGALFAMAGLPLGMVVVSIGFPAMHNRYSIATVLAWAPLVALAVELLGQGVSQRPLLVMMRAARVGMFLLMLFLLWARGLSTAVSASHQAISIDASRRALDHACRQGLPIVFQTRHVMYPTTNGPYGGPAVCETHYLAISDSTLGRMFRPGSNAPRFLRFENEIARLHERIYDYPSVWTQAHVDSLPRFLLFAWDDVLPAGYRDAASFGKAVFPDHTVTRLTEGFALFERR
jgi:hypothetical protein